MNAGQWDLEWGVLGYMRVLGILRNLTGVKEFLTVKSYSRDDSGLYKRNVNEKRKDRGKERGLDSSQMSQNSTLNNRSRDDRNGQSKSSKNSNRNYNYDYEDSYNENNYNDYNNNKKNRNKNNNDYDDESDDSNNGYENNSENTKKEIENKEKYLKLVLDIIFARSTLEKFPSKLWTVRYIQMQCLSNLFNSPNIDEFKGEMVPIFISHMSDFDIRNRLEVNR